METPPVGEGVSTATTLQPAVASAIGAPGGPRGRDTPNRVGSARARLAALSPTTASYATEAVDILLDLAHAVGTSDMHLQPTRVGLDVKFRSDGVLQPLGVIPPGGTSSITSRLKVLADLLTYKSDIPQEGRVEKPRHGREIRVSTFPTMYGERAVLRFFGHGREFTTLEELGNPPQVTNRIRDALVETSGAMLISGPAGSGKSTTLYACLRHLVTSTQGSRSIVSIEDPIEVPVEGVAQSQVDLAAGFDLKTGLRSLMRQDPEVIMVGEIRDRDTAEFAIQASLTGQLLLATFHSDTAASAITRLIEMGIEPFLVRSGLITVVTQRLLRTLCVHCSRESVDPADLCGIEVDRARVAVGCDRCHGTGFGGRAMISEFLDARNEQVGKAILRKGDSRELYRIAIDQGMSPLFMQARSLIREGRTSPAEVWRVLGTAVRG
jgi:type II secretory ATPase GspE/PulE/Tfp pilus assembly ATPase PilB-like protein